MRFHDLALLVLHDRRERPCSTPARPPTVSGAPWRGVSIPSPPASTPISSHLPIVEEGREDPDRVRAPAHARDHARGQPALALEDLRARLVADDRCRSRTSAG